ncbi:MAG: hypothetical protein HN509_14805 [Halobacteriovoraceae bacterium]|jgi:hypothetical protein|nr:hypothetical protein [Halobacteriovoraceae bacterium]MBT5093019.1 hypothetical protein [Halobacteriovoraceae bacterium]
METSTLFSKYFSILLISIVLTGCSTAGRKERLALRSHFASGNFNQSLEVLNEAKIYKDQDSKLLALMEKGLVHHAAGNYHQSVMALGDAKELADKLYTIRLSKKAAAAIANDSYDVFYGEKYERSMIHFYLALNHLLIYQKGSYEAYTPAKKDAKLIPEKKLSKDDLRREQMAARAEVMAWDSYLTTLRNERGGRSVFKNDLLSKVFGGYVHEMIGSLNDLNIALQLYKDAKKLLFRNYNGYKTFNSNSKKFKKDFSKLPGMGKNAVARKYVNKTSYSRSLISFLNYKILSMTQNIRPKDFKNMVSIHKPSVKTLKRLKKERKKYSNVAVVFQRGLIPLKVPQKHYYGLDKAMKSKNSSTAAMAAVGHFVLTTFAANKLGLIPPPRSYSPVGAAVGVQVASVAARHASISFELPKIKNTATRAKTILQVWGKNGKLVQSQVIPIINPMGDIAEEAVAENSATRYTRLGARLAAKHIVGIFAAYLTYKGLRSKNEFLAKSAALLQYTGTSKAIEASERADTRYWSTLPWDLRVLHLSLPVGQYKLKALVKEGANTKSYDLGALAVQKNKKQVVNFRSLN